MPEPDGRGGLKQISGGGGEGNVGRKCELQLSLRLCAGKGNGECGWEVWNVAREGFPGGNDIWVSRLCEQAMGLFLARGPRVTATFTELLREANMPGEGTPSNILRWIPSYKSEYHWSKMPSGLNFSYIHFFQTCLSHGFSNSSLFKPLQGFSVSRPERASDLLRFLNLSDQTSWWGGQGACSHGPTEFWTSGHLGHIHFW